MVKKVQSTGLSKPEIHDYAAAKYFLTLPNRIVGKTRPVAHAITMLVVIGTFAFCPSVSLSKGGDEQDQIILLNDTAAALEDTNPGLSKNLTEYAQEKEKGWEAKNANKEQLPGPITDKYKTLMQERINLLEQAALLIQPTYPLIAQSLNKMVKDMNKEIENEK